MFVTHFFLFKVPRSGSTTMHWQQVNCTGTESRLRECEYKTGSYGCNGAAFEAAVMCRGKHGMETRLMVCNIINDCLAI